MSFFKNLFSGGDPTAAIRKAYEKGQWAEVLNRFESTDFSEIPSSQKQELESFAEAAGDALAAVNISEAAALLRAGEAQRAADHLDLAASQARSDSLHQHIHQLRKQSLQEEEIVSLPPQPNAGGCGGSCQDSRVMAEDCDLSELSSEEMLELILAGYPPAWAEMYVEADPMFLDGFLLAHQGFEAEALVAYDKVPESSRDAKFFFERGALLARLGETHRAIEDLQQSVSLAPEGLALETLVHLEKSIDDGQAAEVRLLDLLAKGGDLAFCHGNLASVFASRNQMDQALDHGIKALEAGTQDPEVIYLTATLLERNGRVGEAESQFSRLSGGGCGSTNVALAEFWLRHGKCLDKALESFKKAASQEPQNLRWIFRTAETYLAKGWEKEGLRLLRSLMAEPELDPGLRTRGTQLMAGHK